MGTHELFTSVKLTDVIGLQTALAAKQDSLPVSVAYVASWTPDATLGGGSLRMVLTGDVAVALPTGAFDGQRMLLEFQASGATRQVTLASGFELAGDILSRIQVLASGAWGYVSLLYRNSTWRVVDADPKTPVVPLVPSPPYTVTYAAAFASSGWTINAATGNNVRMLATGDVIINVPTNGADGQMLMAAITASSASRIVTFASVIQRTQAVTAAVTSAAAGTPTGRTLFAGLRYSSYSSNWTLLALTSEV